MSTEKRAFFVSRASWDRQNCPEIFYKFCPEISLLAAGSPAIPKFTVSKNSIPVTNSLFNPNSNPNRNRNPIPVSRIFQNSKLWNRKLSELSVHMRPTWADLSTGKTHLSDWLQMMFRVKYTHKIPGALLSPASFSWVTITSTRWFACVLLWVFHLSIPNHCLFSKYFIDRLHKLFILCVGVP